MPLPAPLSRHRRRTAAGFTLVELLTVIAIIGILAGLLIPAIGLVQNKFRAVRTRTLFSKLEGAFIDYRNTYNIFPVFTEMNPDTHPWAQQKSEVDSNFLLNDQAGLLLKVLTAPPSYYASGTGSINHNPKRIPFLTLDDNMVSREEPGTTTDPVIIDGFKNAEIGVVVHSGNQKGIHQEAFTRYVHDQFGGGPLIPPVLRPLDQILAFYSLVTSVNSDPVTSDWNVNWNFEEASK